MFIHDLAYETRQQNIKTTLLTFHSTQKRQKQQPFLPMNNLEGLCELQRVHHQKPRNTNTRKHFVTTPVGLIKFKQVAKKQIVSPKQSSYTYTWNPKREIGGNTGPIAHVTIP